MTCVLCQRRPAARGFTCDPCLDRLAQQLHDIEREATILSAAPSLARPNGTRGGTLASERAPARLEVLALTDPRSWSHSPRPLGPACPDCWHDTCQDIRRWQDAYDAHATNLPSPLAVLGMWARLVREDRDLAWPEQVTLASERKTLATHLEWLAAQPYVDEFADDLRRLGRALQRANGSGPVPRKPVGACPTLYDDGECGGQLWPVNENRTVVCQDCHRVFGSDDLQHLGHMLLSDGYVEVVRAEWFTGVPAGTIRRWVTEGRCSSEKDGRRLMVRIADVQAVRDRKKPTAGVAS